MTVRLPSWGGKRISKYGNRRVKVAGVSFDSQSEQRRWEELKLLEKAGEIRNLVLHPRWRLAVNGYHIADYIADYSYEAREPGDGWFKIIEDRKAGSITQTDVFRLKRKLLKAIFGFDIFITGESN